MRIFITSLILVVCFVSKAGAAALPVNEQACFSPDEKCEELLIEFIKSARTSIDVAIYDVTLDQFVHHLAVQSKKIKVRVVVDRRQSKGRHSLVSTLIKAGVPVRYGRQRGIQHDKFTIVDGKMIETGSFNYTDGASHKNQENQIYLSSPAIVQRYKARFEKMWAEGRIATLEVRTPSSSKSDRHR